MCTTAGGERLQNRTELTSEYSKDSWRFMVWGINLRDLNMLAALGSVR